MDLKEDETESLNLINLLYQIMSLLFPFFLRILSVSFMLTEIFGFTLYNYIFM